MRESKQSSTDDSAVDLLVRLGRDLSGPLEALIAEIHALDERIAPDDGAARLVELGHDLRGVLEPVTALARLEATPAEEPSLIDVRSWIAKAVSAPDVAASFSLVPRGELGATLASRKELEEGLGLCLRLLTRMTEDKALLRVHREVHEPSDRIVLTTRLHKTEPTALALLKRAARALQASVEVDGLSLTVEFLVQREPPGASEALAGRVLAFRRDDNPSPEVSSPEVSGTTERCAVILVVDNEPAALAYMSRILELEGFEVVSCSTLERAHEAAHAYRPDVIILDRLQLAREDGDWVRRFKTEPALGRTPLVLVQSVESESLGLVNVSDVVWKPIDPNQVIATIERLTGAGSPPIVVIRDSRDDAKWQRCLEGQTRVVTALSTSEGERLLDTVTPRVLIVDVRHVDGAVALLEQFRRDGDDRRVPVVAVHGRLSKKTRLRLDAVADVRIAYSALSRRPLEAALLAVELGEQRTELGAG